MHGQNWEFLGWEGLCPRCAGVRAVKKEEVCGFNECTCCQDQCMCLDLESRGRLSRCCGIGDKVTRVYTQPLLVLCRITLEEAKSMLYRSLRNQSSGGDNKRRQFQNQRPGGHCAPKVGAWLPGPKCAPQISLQFWKGREGKSNALQCT